jgi:hypothetical protein
VPLDSTTVLDSTTRLDASGIAAASSGTDPKAVLGAYVGPANGTWGPAYLPGYEAWLGRSLNWAHDFCPFGNNWVYLENPDYFLNNVWDTTAYKNRVLLSVGMGVEHDNYTYPDDGTGGRSTLAKGARGDYTSHYTILAQKLVDTGHANMTLRLGWEFNGNWYPWTVSNTDVDIDSGSPTFGQTLPNSTFYKRMWIKIVTAMRAVSGANFTFVWCPTVGDQYDATIGYLAPQDSYPGDAYVDVISVDAYSQAYVWSGYVANNNPANWAPVWNEVLNSNNGLAWQRAFAAGTTGIRTGLGAKPEGLTEWGVGHRQDGHGVGDSPEFVQAMYDWIAAGTNVHHAIYYNTPPGDAWLAYGNEPGTSLYYPDGFPDPNGTSRPNAAAKFLQLFGGLTTSKISALQETFTGATINTTLWNTGGGLTATQSGNQLHVPTSRLVADGGYSYLATDIGYDLTASQTFPFTIASMGADAASDAEVRLTPAGVAPDVATGNRLVITVENGTLYARAYIGGTPTGAFESWLPLTTHAFLRFREAAGTTYIERSADNSTWNTITSFATSGLFALTNVRLEFWAGNYAEVAGQADAVFDAFGSTPTGLTASAGLATASGGTLTIGAVLSAAAGLATAFGGNASVVVTPGSAPAIAVAPAVTPTSATIGTLLSSTVGTWVNTPTSFTYQWKRGAVTNLGAGTSQYTVVAGDVGQSITCVVTATNSSGSTAATSNAVVPVAADVTPPAAPTGLTATGQAGLILLDWNDNTEPDLHPTSPYIIERALAAAGPYTVIDTAPTSNYTDFVAGGVTYFYRVRAQDNAP